MGTKFSYRLALLCLAYASLLLLSLTACNDPQQTAPSTKASSAGSIGSTLTTPNNTTFTLLKSTKSDSSIFLHFHIHNGDTKELDLLGKGNLYQIKASTGQTMVLATLPSSDMSQLYPPLPTRIAPAQTVDGWVRIESAPFNGALPAAVAYVFDQVAAQACKVPGDMSTCKPAQLDKSLLWYL